MQQNKHLKYQSIKMIAKRFIATIMMLMITLSIALVAPPNVAEARPAAATGNVQQRLDQFMQRFPHGSAFTVNGRACTPGSPASQWSGVQHQQNSTRGTCNNCLLSAVMSNMGYSNVSLRDGNTCVAFARYAFWWIFGVSVSGRSSSGTRQVSRADALPGDLVIWDGHWAIYLGGGRILDSNSRSRIAGVYHTRTLSNFSSWGNRTFVRANNYDQINGGTSTQQTQQTRPDAPTGASGTFLDNSRARISWNASARATSYEVQFWSRSHNAWRVDPDYRNNSATTYTSTGMQNHNYFDFRVRAVNSAGASAWTQFRITKQQVQQPQQPAAEIVRYDANGGSGAPANHGWRIRDGFIDYILIPNTVPTRSGHTFRGWSPQRNGEDFLWQPGERVYSHTGPHNWTLYAQWERAVTQQQNGVVTIRYNANGGTGAPASHTVTKDDNGIARFHLTNGRPTRTGYAFIGWRFENSTDFDIDSPGQHITFPFQSRFGNETLTYFAQWEHIATQQQNGVVTIRYNANGGTGAPASHSVTKDDNGIARFHLTNGRPTRTGYEFIGWRFENSNDFDIDSSGQHITFPFQSRFGNETLTYFAHWRAVSSQQPTPTVPTQVRTLTIRYSANGGAGAPPSHTVAVTENERGSQHVSFNLSSVIPTRPGYTFLGWSTNLGVAMGPIRAAGTHFSTYVHPTLNELPFYARWQRS
ncbi:MAG: InlB B-repeat-containing protein [Oscillospiraceae bacterium]|nr:InlB B-repeat-containing protein [Oscillospiraceae bacterium]